VSSALSACILSLFFLGEVFGLLVETRPNYFVGMSTKLLWKHIAKELRR
jgi:hypothetical protein